MANQRGAQDAYRVVIRTEQGQLRSFDFQQLDSEIGYNRGSTHKDEKGSMVMTPRTTSFGFEF